MSARPPLLLSAALLLALLALAGRAADAPPPTAPSMAPPAPTATSPAPAAAPAATADDGDDDDESDSAPFMIVVEHSSQWRCSGSLVSLRTAVTSAACARGRGPPPGAGRPLWALAAAAAAGQAARAAGARRVVRVAAAGSAGDDAVQVVGASAWGAALLDMAVLELESPFGSGAGARPILMATSAGECGGVGAVCHVVRAIPRNDSLAAKLRIVDATLSKGEACAALARYWASVRDQTLCLTGPELCPSDWGAGVVCGGKLCGVVSRSARAAGGEAPAPYQTLVACGSTHVAQSVARWRHFLHCAHTLRACGRGDCADLCSERRLTDADRETVIDETPSGPKPRARVSPAASAGTAAATSDAARRDTPAALQYEDYELRPSTSDHRAPVSEHGAPTTEHAAPMSEQGTPWKVHGPPTSEHGAPTRVHAFTTTSAPPRATTSQRRYGAPTRTRQVTAPAPATTGTPATPSAPAATRPAASARPAGSTSAPRAGALTTHRTVATKSTALVSVRPTPLFEPNRPDFKSGEYGDNAADYVAPADEQGGGAGGASARKSKAPPTGRSARPDRNQRLDRLKRPESVERISLSAAAPPPQPSPQRDERPPPLAQPTGHPFLWHEEQPPPVQLQHAESLQQAKARPSSATPPAAGGPPTAGASSPAVQVERLRQKRPPMRTSRAAPASHSVTHICTNLFFIVNYIYFVIFE